MDISWERADFLAFSTYAVVCRLKSVCFFPIWCLGQDVEFDCINSRSLHFHLLDTRLKVNKDEVYERRAIIAK